ncbi:MAG: hypothetical protein RL485_1103 [Bacteroidota bacterium]
MRYQNFSIRSNRLAEAAQKGGWVLTDANAAGAHPVWVVRHPSPKSDIKRIAWSLMHGNEPTGFEALLQFIESGTPQCDWTLVPLVNPTGIDRFERLTAEGIDLNRCARILGPTEAELLKELLRNNPFDLALNLHDQRSIFHPAEQNLPSTLSVLAPRARSQQGEFAPVRAKQWAGWLSAFVANRRPDWGLARFDDQYYPQAFGEWCQELGIPTITIETGVSLGDYSRDEIARILGAALIDLDKTTSPEAKYEQIYDSLAFNASTGIDLALHGPSGSSFWRVVEEVHPDLGYQCGIQNVGELGSGSAYCRIQLSQNEFASITSKPFWTSSELQASASAALRSFATGLPK